MEQMEYMNQYLNTKRTIVAKRLAIIIENIVDEARENDGVFLSGKLLKEWPKKYRDELKKRFKEH